MSTKDYYKNYWQNKIKGGIVSSPPEWTEENLVWHHTFFKNYIGKRVLDVGGGDGTLLDFLSKNLNLREMVVCDISKEAVTAGKKKYTDLEFKVGDACDLSFSKKSLDTILAVEFLEHVLDVDKCLSEISRVLRRGGHLCVTTTDFNLLKRVAIGLFFWDKFFYPNNPHIRFFTKKTLEDIVQKHGFKQVDYKWNRSYFGLMPKGQMAVFKRV